MTVNVDLTFEDIIALEEYYWKMYKAIPVERYKEMTMAGHTFEVTANNFLERYKYYNDLKNHHWPK